MVGSDVGRATGLRRDMVLGWFQDMAFACDILLQGFRHCSTSLVSLHQSFPDAVSVPRVVAALGKLMGRASTIMAGELPGPRDPRRGLVLDTAQLLLEFEEVCKSEEASQGMLMSLERRLWALQEVRVLVVRGREVRQPRVTGGHPGALLVTVALWIMGWGGGGGGGKQARGSGMILRWGQASVSPRGH
jgi:hypothetical protein